jgi:integrase
LDTPASAVQGREFRPYLESRGLSRSTVNKRISIARSVFKTITPNPFAEVTAGRQDNSARQFYVAADTILAVCRYADPELKLVLMLARFAGLRVPSELLAMRFSDIEWEHDKIYVRSPKTEHHKGGEGRYVPLFHQVRSPLLEAFDRARDGSGKVFPDSATVSTAFLRIRLTRLLGRLEVGIWPRLFQNLRASWETDCLKLWPAETPKWAGHSHLVSQRNYHMQTNDSFRAAAAPPPAQFAASRTSGQGVGESTTPSVTHAGQSAYNVSAGILPGLKPSCNSRPNRTRAVVGATTKRRQKLLARAYRRTGGGRWRYSSFDRPLMPGCRFWCAAKDGDPMAFRLARRHYSAEKTPRPKIRQFVGPGQKLVLISPREDALFAWRKFIDDSGQQGVNCAIFRNESKQLSSAMILEAERIAWARWPGERFYTYVKASKVRSRHRLQMTKSGLLILEKVT